MFTSCAPGRRRSAGQPSWRTSCVGTIIGADTDGNAVQGKVEKVVMLDGAVSVLAAGKTVPVESILQVE